MVEQEGTARASHKKVCRTGAGAFQVRTRCYWCLVPQSCLVISFCNYKCGVGRQLQRCTLQTSQITRSHHQDPRV